MDRIPGTLIPPTRDEFEDAVVEAKAKAKSFRIKATYAYEILHDQRGSIGPTWWKRRDS